MVSGELAGRDRGSGEQHHRRQEFKHVSQHIGLAWAMCATQTSRAVVVGVIAAWAMHDDAPVRRTRASASLPLRPLQRSSPSHAGLCGPLHTRPQCISDHRPVAAESGTAPLTILWGRSRQRRHRSWSCAGTRPLLEAARKARVPRGSLGPASGDALSTSPRRSHRAPRNEGWTTWRSCRRLLSEVDARGLPAGSSAVDGSATFPANRSSIA